MDSNRTDVQAETDEDIFRECAARLSMAVEAEGDNRAAGVEALRFRYGDQWAADIANERKLDERPAITINHTDTQCRKIENQLKQSRPRIKAHPVDGGADIDTAEVVTGLVRHIEYRSNASVAYDTAGASALNIGWGYIRITSEYVDEKSFDQELCIKPIRNTFTGYIDPSAVLPDGSDMCWFIISEKMKRQEFKRRYPSEPLNDWQGEQGPGDQTLDWENKEEIRLAEYYRLHEKRETVYRMSDGRSLFKSELPSAETMQALGITIATDKNGKPIQRESSRCTVQWFRLNGKRVVDRRDLPGYCIPIVRCEGNVLDLNGKTYRYGMVKNLMEPAQMYNYWRTAQTERYALAPKAPWVMAEGQADGHHEWDDANRRSYSRLTYKPVLDEAGNPLPAPMRQPPAPVEPGMAEAAASAERDLMAVAGAPQIDPSVQQRVIGGNKYLQRRQAMQDLTHFQYFDNQTLAIAQVGRILLEWIPYFYDTPRMQRIIGEDGIPQMTQLNQKQEVSPGVMQVKNNLTVGKYDVVMDAGPSYQTKREESVDSLINLLGTPLAEPIVKVGSDLIVRNMDFAGASDLADRLSTTTPDGMKKAVENLPKQAQTIVQTLMQQNQQLTQQMQQMQMELRYRSGIEQMKQQGETARTHLKVAAEDANSRRDFEGWLHDIDVKRQTALDTTEIKAASTLLNTHVEAEHEKQAAKALIKEGQEAAKH